MNLYIDVEASLDKWNIRFIELAKYISTYSKDPSTQVGCVIVGPDREIRSTGFNGFPRGVKDDERLHDRAEKYPRVVHAEGNAVAQAARIGTRLKGCSAYLWPLPPCSNCAKLLIQAGVQNIFSPDQHIPERWQEDVKRANDMFKEAGVDVFTVKMKKE